MFTWSPFVNWFPGATTWCSASSVVVGEMIKQKKTIECNKNTKNVPNNVMKYGVIWGNMLPSGSRLCGCYCWRCCYCYDIIPKQYDNCFVMLQWWDPSSNVPQATRRSPLSTSSLRKLTNTAIAWKGSRFLEHFHQERQEDDQRSFIYLFLILRRPASLYWKICQTKAKLILW